MDYPFMPEKVKSNAELIQQELRRYERCDKIVQVCCYVILIVSVVAFLGFIGLQIFYPVQTIYEYEQDGVWLQADKCRTQYGEIICHKDNETFKVDKYRRSN